MFCTEQRTDLVACMCTGEPCAAIVKLEAKSKNLSSLGAVCIAILFNSKLFVPFRQKN